MVTVSRWQHSSDGSCDVSWQTHSTCKYMQSSYTGQTVSHSLTSRELTSFSWTNTRTILHELYKLFNCLEHTVESNQSRAGETAATYIQKTGIVVFSWILGCLVTCLTGQMDVASGVCGVIYTMVNMCRLAVSFNMALVLALHRKCHTHRGTCLCTCSASVYWLSLHIWCQPCMELAIVFARAA